MGQKVLVSLIQRDKKMTEPSPPPSDVPTRTLARMGKTGITQLKTGASKLSRVCRKELRDS